jgi:hypothetical protein
MMLAIVILLSIVVVFLGAIIVLLIDSSNRTGYNLGVVAKSIEDQGTFIFDELRRILDTLHGIKVSLEKKSGA